MPFLKIFFRLEIDRKNYTPPKSPYLAICNHGAFMDFVVVMLALYPRRFNAVTAQKFFLYKPLHWFLPMMGCIPKNLFDADPRSIIGIKKVLKRGDNVLLFPEGRCETDGVYTGMHKATGKLIKKLGVSVVSASIDGAYKCMPFWRSGIRFGRVRVVLSNLFSVQSLQTLDVDEINDAIDRRISRDEDPPPRKPFRTFGTRRLAEGLHNILYWCPKCNEEFTTQTKGNVISCAACGNAGELDAYMNLQPVIRQKDGSAVSSNPSIPATIHEWYKAQARYEAQKLHKDMPRIGTKAQVRLPSDVPGGGMVVCGEGVVSLDAKGWYYDGDLRGEHVSLHFPIDLVPALPIDPDDVFQIYAHGVFYCFVPERPRECIKYSVIGECAYWKFASEIKMTPSKDSGF